MQTKKKRKRKRNWRKNLPFSFTLLRALTRKKMEYVLSCFSYLFRNKTRVVDATYFRTYPRKKQRCIFATFVGGAWCQMYRARYPKRQPGFSRRWKGPSKLTRFLRFVVLPNSNWLVPRIYKFESSWFTLLRIAIVNFRWQYLESRSSREWAPRNFSTSNLLSSNFPVSCSS